MEKYISIEKEMIVKGKLIEVSTVNEVYYAVFDLIIPTMTNGYQKPEFKMLKNVVIDKALLDTLKKSSSKMFNVAISLNTLDGGINITKIEVPSEQKVDTNKILKFIKLNEITQSMLKKTASFNNEVALKKVDTLLWIEALSISRDIGLLVGDIEENIGYDTESCKDFIRKIDNIVSGITKLQTEDDNLAFQRLLISLSSELLNLKFNLLLFMENLVLTQQ